MIAISLDAIREGSFLIYSQVAELVYEPNLEVHEPNLEVRNS